MTSSRRSTPMSPSRSSSSSATRSSDSNERALAVSAHLRASRRRQPGTRKHARRDSHRTGARVRGADGGEGGGPRAAARLAHGRIHAARLGEARGARRRVAAHEPSQAAEGCRLEIARQGLSRSSLYGQRRCHREEAARCGSRRDLHRQPARIRRALSGSDPRPMTRAAIAFLLALALLATGAAADDSKDGGRRVRELMHKSGLWKQIAQLEPNVQLGIDQAHARDRGKKALEAKDLARLKAAASRAFDTRRLRAEFEKELAAELSREDEAEVLVWLSSDLGKRLTALEEKSDEAGEVTRREKEAPVYFATVPPQRVERFKRLAKAIRLGEANAGMIINMSIGLAYGFAIIMPPHDTAGVEATKRQLEAQRPQMIAAFEASGATEFAYTYRDVSDADVDRYVTLTEA